MRDARRAGMYPASIATLIIKAVAATRVTGSAAVKPKSWLEINFAAPITKGNPAATPITTSSNDPRNTSHMTSPPCALSAIRIPISFVRPATAYAMIPYMPMHASRAASAPNSPESLVIMRLLVSDCDTSFVHRVYFNRRKCCGRLLYHLAHGAGNRRRIARGTNLKSGKSRFGIFQRLETGK